MEKDDAYQHDLNLKTAEWRGEMTGLMKSLNGEMTEVKADIKEIKMELTIVSNKVTVLKAKAAILGAIGGTILAGLIQLIIKFAKV